MDELTKLDFALEHGNYFPIFPVEPNGKKPLIQDWPNQATQDEEKIRAWWTQYPEANIGSPTAGYLVIDIDDPATPWPGDPEKALDLAGAPQVFTPRGGRHIRFLDPEKKFRNTAKKLADGIDTRAAGGFVLMPGSSINGKQYAAVSGSENWSVPLPPQWLVEQLSTPVVSEIQQETKYPRKIGEGKRNHELARIAGSCRRIGLEYEEILGCLAAVNDSRCQPPLSIPEISNIAKSICRFEPEQAWQAVIEGWWDEDRPFSQNWGTTIQTAGGGGCQTDDLEPLPTSPADPGPFPVDLLYPPGWLGEFVNHITETGHTKQPIIALAACLAGLGAIAGRKICDVSDTRTNIYTVGVLNSGKGKEHSRSKIKKIFYLGDSEDLIGPEGFASHAGLVSAVKTNPSILFPIDEMGRMFKTISDPGDPHLYHIPTILMKFYTSSDTVWRGDAYADPEKNKVIVEPCACLFGTTVPRSFFESLTIENCTEGLVSRLLIFEGDNTAEQVEKDDKEIPKNLIDFVKDWKNILPLSQATPGTKPMIVPATPEAAQHLFKFMQEARALEKILGEPFGTLWTRAREKANKLALLYAASKFGPTGTIIDREGAKWACDMARYLTNRLVWLASQHCAEGAFDAKRKKVLRVIREAGSEGITKRNLIYKTRAFAPRERDEILNSLAQSGEIYGKEIKTKTKSGIVYLAS